VAVRLVVYGSTRGSVRLSGSVAVRGCVRQSAVCGSARGSVRYYMACVAVRLLVSDGTSSASSVWRHFGAHFN
jgi:hypothetical protein